MHGVRLGGRLSLLVFRTCFASVLHVVFRTCCVRRLRPHVSHVLHAVAIRNMGHGGRLRPRLKGESRGRRKAPPTGKRAGL